MGNRVHGARVFTWLLLSGALAYAGCSSSLLDDGGTGSGDGGTGGDGESSADGGNKDGAALNDGAGDGASIDGNNPTDGGLDSTVNPVDGSSDGTVVTGDSGETDGGDATVVIKDGSTSTDAKLDVAFTFDSGNTDDAGFNSDAACVNAPILAEPAKLDLYFMFDRSTSMKEPTWVNSDNDITRPWDCNIGQSVPDKWCRSINSLSQYLNSTSATGNAAALQYFASLDNSVCTGVEYAIPEVPSTKTFLTLPNTSFDTSLNNAYPMTSTPTIAAVRGLGLVAADPVYHRVGRKLVNILITDGDPNGCNVDPVWPHTGDIPYIQTQLQGTYTSYNVPTYIIGMTGATFANLETMAIGGNGAVHNTTIGNIQNTCGNGAQTCRHWNVADGNNNALLETLNLIQKFALSCSYAVPTSDAGLVDTNKIQVQYEPGVDAGAPQILNKVTNVAACLADGGTGGWYYDNNTNPTSINLCASTCQTIENDIAGKVRLLLGCQGS